MFGAIKRWWQNRKVRSQGVAMLQLVKSPRVLSGVYVTGVLRDLGFPTVVEDEGGYLKARVGGFDLLIAGIPERLGGSGPLNRDARAEQAFEDHQGYLTVHAYGAPEGEDLFAARPILGKISAALADDSTLVYLDLSTGRYCLPEMRDELLAGNVDEALNSLGDPVFRVQDENAEINAAIEEARRRWPEFVEAFPRRGTDDTFMVKIRFQEGDQNEHMWVMVESCDLETVRGTVANDPFYLRRPRNGDAVTAPAADLSDWLYTFRDEAVGGFVERILRARGGT